MLAAGPKHKKTVGKGPVEKAAPKEYKKLDKGQADKTEAAKKTATKYFDSFLETKQLPPFKASLLKKDEFLCDKGLYQEFATYLVDTALDVKLKRLSVDNAKGIFGNIVTMAQTTFSAHHTFHAGLDNWYANTRSAIHTKIFTRLIDNGDPIDTKNDKSLSFELLSQMVEVLWQKNDIVSIGKASMIINSYNAIGRGGEVAFSNFRKWSHCMQYNTLDAEWSERKTLEGDHMGFFAHCMRPEMCLLYHLSGWLIVRGPFSSQIHRNRFPRAVRAAPRTFSSRAGKNPRLFRNPRIGLFFFLISKSVNCHLPWNGTNSLHLAPSSSAQIGPCGHDIFA